VLTGRASAADTRTCMCLSRCRRVGVRDPSMQWRRPRSRRAGAPTHGVVEHVRMCWPVDRPSVSVQNIRQRPSPAYYQQDRRAGGARPLRPACARHDPRRAAPPPDARPVPGQTPGRLPVTGSGEQVLEIILGF
jgi:hypothetical protein